MKRNYYIYSISVLIFLFVSCSPETKYVENFSNPILAGFYPDPSICEVDGEFYLINSTFSYFPGIPIFKSRDLVNWEQIGNAMDRAEQMNLQGLGVSRGIFAPDISFHDGKFYIVCTLADAGGNFVITADNAAGPWSNPIWLPEINGIDPSLYFNTDGKTYILYNSIAPDNNPLYDGHRTIRISEFDFKNLKVVGDETILINGGTDISKKPIWIEGPHIYFVNNYYYLMAAEGGTGDQHSEVIFRSENIMGPYESYSNNPILTQRNLDPSRNNPITCTGHADMVQTREGDWWAVFLGCRPYSPVEEGFFNTGRETFLAPVEWSDGWPIIIPDSSEVKYYYPISLQIVPDPKGNSFSGNFDFYDEFDSGTLGLKYLFLRGPGENWYELQSENSRLKIDLLPVTCNDKATPAFIAHRQQHLNGSVIISLEFHPLSDNEKAGLAVFQNEDHYYYLCKSISGNKPVVQLFKSKVEPLGFDRLEKLKSFEIMNENSDSSIYLKIEANGRYYNFLYSLNNENWTTVQDSVDATFLSTKTAGGFVGCVYAMYATSLGLPSNNSAYYNWFRYKGNDEVYSKN